MPNLKVAVCIPVFNEAGKIGALLSKFEGLEVGEVVVINDNSTDGSVEEIEQFDVTLLDNRYRKGVGSSIRTAIEYACRKGRDIIVVMAGNGKDDPREIPKLLKPILEGGYDYVQGSRFLEGGKWSNLPLFRLVCIKLYTRIFAFLTGFHGTDVTNGFRAYRLNIFDNPKIDIEGKWLGAYELEYYIHHKVITLGYRITEVPVSKIYPGGKGVSYSKIKPLVGWWSMIRAIVFLTLRIKK